MQNTPSTAASRAGLSTLFALVAALCTAVLLAACLSASSAHKPEAASAQLEGPEQPDQAPIATIGAQPVGSPCGGEHGACDATGFCRYPAEDICGDGGSAGVCEARPRGCKRDCPGVCGCNGHRFCNTCVARARGFSVRHGGPCMESPDASE
jgi:hypothetical protein